MRRVLIQAGHSAAFEPHQQGGGGAPGEADWATALATRIASRLSTRDVQVTLVGCWNLDNSNAPAAVTEQDYDLALALHYDAAVYAQNTGCFADRAADDPVGAAADRFITLWEPIYTKATGLPLHNERRNANTWDYYAWRATSDKTPGVLIEHGVGPEADLDVAADADTAAVLAFLDAPAPPPTTNGGTTVPDAPDPITEEQRAVLDLLGLRAIHTADDLQKLYDWTDETVKERDDLAKEVQGLHGTVDQQKLQITYLQEQLAAAQTPPAPAPMPAPAPAAATVTRVELPVRVLLSDGTGRDLRLSAEVTP